MLCFKKLRRNIGRFKTYSEEVIVLLLAKVLSLLRLGRFVFLRKIFFDSFPKGSFLVAQFPNETFIVQSKDMVIGRTTFSRGSYDFEKLESVVRLLGLEKPGSLLVDVGANIGVICIPAVSRGLFERAVAFEPDPGNFKMLQINVILNNLTGQIEIHNLALGKEKDGSAFLALSEENNGDHRLLPSNDYDDLSELKGRSKIKVRVSSLDSVIVNFDPLKSLFWLDTQGFEGFILQGAQRILKTRVAMVLEFWPYGMKANSGFKPLKDALLSGCYHEFIDLSEPRTGWLSIGEHSLDELYSKIGESGKFTDILVR